MRQILVVLAAMLVVGACSAAGPTSSPIQAPSEPAAASHLPTTEPTSGPTSEPTSDPTSDPVPIEIAVAYAIDAGFRLDDEVSPVSLDEEPIFDPMMLRRVSLALADGDDAALDVYLDDAGAIRVVDVEHHLRPTGSTLDQAAIFDVANAYLLQVGIDPTTGTLHVAAHGLGYWYLTFDREIEGYRVANAPMAWWLHGDKAYLELREDGSLQTLYAIRPDAEALPAILDIGTLNARLEAVARRSPVELSTYDLEFLWVRPNAQHTMALTLSLGYCATHIFERGWEAWCVDAGTGEPSAFGSGVD